VLQICICNAKINMLSKIYDNGFKTWEKVTRVCKHRNNFLTIEPTRCTNFSHLFWNKTLRVSDSSSVHHQEFFTVRTALICHKVCCMYIEKLLMMDRGTVRNM
jgi:hypothetical protein